MDNLELLDELPREEVIVLLLEMTNRLGVTRASRLQPLSERDRHWVSHGHPLTFGCCAGAPEGLQTPA